MKITTFIAIACSVAIATVLFKLPTEPASQPRASSTSLEISNDGYVRYYQIPNDGTIIHVIDGTVQLINPSEQTNQVSSETVTQGQ